MASAPYSFPGLASATGTRLDSSAKHIMACKVHENQMMTWCAEPTNARNYLHIHRMKYCMHKDDLVLNAGNPLNECSSDVMTARAYPAVVSNLGDMSEETKEALLRLYATAHTGLDFLEFKDKLRKLVTCASDAKVREFFAHKNSTDLSKVVREIKDLPYFTAQGYSLGTAYASPLSGDTVGSVLIGGMQTVRNGHFEIRSGQMVQWYFDFEADMFHRASVEDRGTHRTIVAGTRKAAGHSKSVSQIQDTHKFSESDTDLRRKEFHDRELGALDSYPVGGLQERKHNVFYPKPYMLCANGAEHYGDKIRIFAKCVNGARPYEMVDLMLMTQSL